MLTATVARHCRTDASSPPRLATALGAGKVAARSGGGVFGAVQLGQRPIETFAAQLGRQLGSGRVQS